MLRADLLASSLVTNGPILNLFLPKRSSCYKLSNEILHVGISYKFEDLTFELRKVSFSGSNFTIFKNLNVPIPLREKKEMPLDFWYDFKN